MTQFWRIETPDGPYTSDHPQISGGTLAHLFHDKRFAEETVSHSDAPESLTLREVTDREKWGEMIVDLGITHV